MDKNREVYKKDFDSQANSYIEACFEEKCRSMTGGEDILNSWRADKKDFTEYTSTIKMDFQHYSLHDKTHSLAILDAVYMVVGKERVESLCTSDLWLLLEAAYAHDIGMSTTYKELLDMWETIEFKEYVKKCLASDCAEDFEVGAIYKKIGDVLHNKKEFEQYAEHRYYDEIEKKYDMILHRESWPIIWERYILLLYTGYIRERHHEFSQKKINEIKKEALECEHERMYGIVGEVAFLHGVDFDNIFERLSPTEKGFKDETMHPQFAAAMLRLGDLLDMDSNRFNIRMLKHFGIIPLESALHIEKHKSIQHISYDTKRISAHAKSDDLDVCKTVNRWFRMLDKEVKDLICCWNEIVPKELIGCRLNKCDLKIYYQGSLYNGDKLTDFQIDTEKVYNLFIGENIYQTRFEFIREYLQNAMDASKMQLWLNEKQRFEQKLLNKRTVFDYFGDRIEDFKIKILLNVKMEQDTVTVCFVDKGIGMEEDCVSAISNISTNSWHRRTNYVQELNDMPCWLCPSGGFGIGVQSAFMMANKIEFMTKSQTEFQGKHIYLENNKNGGRISEYTDGKIKVFGTTVKIEIPIIDILQVIQEEQEDFVKMFADEDVFDQSQQEAIFQKLIFTYVEKIAEYSMFPIEIGCGHEVPKIVGRKWYIQGGEVHKVKRNDNKEVIYQLSDDRLTVWDGERETLVSYEFHLPVNDVSQIRFYYHGIYIENESVKTNYPFMMHIIYFRKEVKETLKINRDSFRSKYAEVKNQDMRRYYLLFLELWNKLSVKITLNSRKNRTWFQQLILTEWYENLEKSSLHENGEFEKLQDMIPISVLTLNENFVQNPSSDILKEHLFVEKLSNLKEIKTKLSSTERILFVLQGDYFVSDVMDASRMQVKEFLKQVQREKSKIRSQSDDLSENRMYKDMKIIRAFADPESIIVRGNNMKQLISMWKKESVLVTLELNDAIYCQILMCSRSKNQDMQEKQAIYSLESFIKNNLFPNNIREYENDETLSWKCNCPITLAVKKTSNLCEDILWVDRIISRSCVITLEDGRQLRSSQITPNTYNYLILPFTQVAFDRLSDYKKSGRLISYERFKDIVGLENMTVLYKWVERYQTSNKKLSIHEIKKQYVQLIEMIYDECFGEKAEE